VGGGPHDEVDPLREVAPHRNWIRSGRWSRTITQVSSTTPPRRPQAGRPAQLSREQIVEAALASNLDTLTMRELAARLNVTHGALYRWVPGREALFDLISEVIVDRVVPDGEPDADGWQSWLARLAWAMHDQFLAVPGYATHVVRPHQHNPLAFGKLRDGVIAAFTAAGTTTELAEQSWYIFSISLVSWLAVQETPLDLGTSEPRFDLFLDALLRGLPAQLPSEPAPPEALRRS
jgi:AcrR family transcriptional regulator